MSDLRRDPVTGRWVVIASERIRRPQDFRPQPVGAIGGDRCPFCEGQEALAGRELLAWRPTGSPNSPGWQVRVVANRDPALRVEGRLGEVTEPLFQSLGGLGAHEVVIETPDHHATFATMSGEAIGRVLWAWRERIRDLRRDMRLTSFVIVKNVGAAAGARLDHSHSQLLALPLVPQHLREEMAGAAAHYAVTRQCVICDLAARETERDIRVIGSDERSVAFAPFASRVPFEVWVIPREHRAGLEDATDATLEAVGARLGDIIRRLGAVLVSPPYSLLVHTAPVGADSVAYHWHVEIIPRLQPVGGLAWDGGVHVNPVPPEEAAEVLREAGISGQKAER